MWYVYRHGDTYSCGITVKSEKEAIKRCEENPELDYVYVG